MPERRHLRVLWAPHAWVAGGWHDTCSSPWTQAAAGPSSARRRPRAARGGRARGAGAAGPGERPQPCVPARLRRPGRAARRRDDDFWSWRDRMYGVALRITPEELRAVAARLYGELLRGGYTQVCEFTTCTARPTARAMPTRRRWLGARRCRRRRRHRPHPAAGAVRARRFRQPAAADQRRFADDAEDVLVMRNAIAPQAGRW